MHAKLCGHLAGICIVILTLGIMAIVCLPSMSAAEEAGVPVAFQVSSGAVKGKNITGEANTVELLYAEDSEYGIYSFTDYDVTGDGKRDVLQLGLSESNLRILINGSLMQELKREWGYPFSWVLLHTLENGSPVLYASFTENGEACYAYYQYSKGKLKKVASDSGILKASQGYQLQPLAKAKHNKLIVEYNLNTNAMGYVEAKFAYAYKKGKLTLSNTTSSISYNVGDKYGKPAVQAKKSFKAYKNLKLKKKAFTVKKGARFKIVALNSHGGKLYIKVKYGKKYGWLKAGKTALYKGASKYEW